MRSDAQRWTGTLRAARPLRGILVLVLGFVWSNAAVHAAETSAEDEATVIAFVRANHPELADILASLKPMRPDDYKKAVRDLNQVSKALTQLNRNNPERYALSLEAWKARSRVDVLAAKLASAEGSTAELESELRRAVAAQLDTEVRQQRFEKHVVEERLKKVSENLSRLESRREMLTEARYQALLRRSRNTRRKATVTAKPNANAKLNAATGPNRDESKGERPR